MTEITMYFFDPELTGDNLTNIASYAKNIGHNMSCRVEDVSSIVPAKRLIDEINITKILPTTEELLPDNIPRNTLVDRLRCKLDQIKPTNSFLIIDRYLYPKEQNSDYEQLFHSVFEKSLKMCSVLNVVTSNKRNKHCERRIHDIIKSINKNIKINKKYSEIFHDRFWIADESKGIVIGISLNGIGKKVCNR